MISLASYASAGYFVTRYVPRPSYFDAELLPEKILSACSCISEFIPDTWAIQWTSVPEGERQEKATSFQIASGRFELFIQWATSQFDNTFGWPNVCFSLQTARTILSEFVTAEVEPIILGLGLHETLIDEFSVHATPPKSPPEFAPIGASGVYLTIQNRLPLEPDGLPLGFELLAFQYGLDHSWLCNGLETDIHKKLQLKPNEHGFLDSFQDALRAAKYVQRDEVKAEPGLWLPWLIVKY